jgi:glycosyltransferase involved in cell wall biosynthesis
MTLMTDSDLRQKMGMAGRERVVANFDYRIVAEKFIKIINKKLGIE